MLMYSEPDFYSLEPCLPRNSTLADRMSYDKQVSSTRSGTPCLIQLSQACWGRGSGEEYSEFHHVRPRFGGELILQAKTLKPYSLTRQQPTLKPRKDKNSEPFLQYAISLSVLRTNLELMGLSGTSFLH